MRMFLKFVHDDNTYCKYGLSLSQEDVSAILTARKDTFVEESRIELGRSIIPKLIETFCDSPYISQNDYRDSIIRLQEIFFHYNLIPQN